MVNNKELDMSQNNKHIHGPEEGQVPSNSGLSSIRHFYNLIDWLL